MIIQCYILLHCRLSCLAITPRLTCCFWRGKRGTSKIRCTYTRQRVHINTRCVVIITKLRLYVLLIYIWCDEAYLSNIFYLQVFGVGIPNPYRIRPFLGAKLPINASFSPLISLYNPHSSTLQVLNNACHNVYNYGMYNPFVV